jgi:hypothetical protein
LEREEGSYVNFKQGLKTGERGEEENGRYEKKRE